jgi:hypothetical protein
MKQLFENKKLMIGIAIGLVLIIGAVLFFVFRKSAVSNTVTPNGNVANNASNTTVAKEIADTSGGTISANSAASKGTLFV